MAGNMNMVLLIGRLGADPQIFTFEDGGGLAEGKGFEPPKGISSFNDLANRRLQPLGHPSAGVCGRRKATTRNANTRRMLATFLTLKSGAVKPEITARAYSPGPPFMLRLLAACAQLFGGVAGASRRACAAGFH